MRATIFGAGNIGRGLVGAVLADSGYSLTYVDADAELVALLDRERSFTVTTPATVREYPIESMLHAADIASVVGSIASSDLIATAVGPPVLSVVAPAIAEGLAAHQGTHVNVLACENVHPNSSMLGGYVDAQGRGTGTTVGFPDVVVDRIVPGMKPAVNVDVEEHFEFVVDRSGWVGATPDPTSIIFAEDLDDYRRRKLWLVNGQHAMAAWLGIERGHKHIHEAVGDAEIASVLDETRRLAVVALAASSDEFTREELDAYAAVSVARFEDATLPDQTRRVARNPALKLGEGERVLAPALAAERLGEDATVFAPAIVAGLRLGDSSIAGVDQLQRALDDGGVAAFLDGAGLQEGSALRARIIELMEDDAMSDSNGAVTETLVIANPAGLHARPAAAVVEQAQQYDATVTIKKGDKQANAASIMSVLALGATKGDTITLEAEGQQAGDAVLAIREIVMNEEH